MHVVKRSVTSKRPLLVLYTKYVVLFALYSNLKSFIWHCFVSFSAKRQNCPQLRSGPTYHPSPGGASGGVLLRCRRRHRGNGAHIPGRNAPLPGRNKKVRGRYCYKTFPQSLCKATFFVLSPAFLSLPPLTQNLERKIFQKEAAIARARSEGGRE